MGSASDTMRAMRAFSADPGSLRYGSVPVPRPSPGEVLVQVRATAVTAGELTWPEAWPVIPCHDLSGVVTGAGPLGSGWRDGDQVFGLIGFDRPGAATEYTTVPAADLAAKPAATGHIAAAA
jgi:NADPH:quinone reductase-like Zn-dependent oxidoreductase